MLVTRTSILTGKKHTMDMAISATQVANYEKGQLVQHAFPNLGPTQREFIISGITPEEWDKTFGKEQ